MKISLDIGSSHIEISTHICNRKLMYDELYIWEGYDLPDSFKNVFCEEREIMNVNSGVLISSRKLLLHINTQLTYEHNVLYVGEFYLIDVPIDIDVIILLQGFHRFHHTLR